MTANHRTDDSPSFMVSTLTRLAAKEPDEGRAAILDALAHIAMVSDKNSADLSDLKSRVGKLEDGKHEIKELRATNDRQDREIEMLRTRVAGHEQRVKAAWWAAGKIGAAAAFLGGVAWTIYEKFSK